MPSSISWMSLRNDTGFSLIELLVSLVLLSMMLLGLDAMQITSLREARSAYYFSVAMQQLNEMAERLLVLADHDATDVLMHWNQQNQEALPQGRGTLNGAYPDQILSIFWGNKTESRCHKNQIGSSGCLSLTLKNKSV